jgi:hypothetical protein
MPFTPQQRSMAILGGVFGGGLLITFLLVSLVSGGDDDDRRVSIGPNRPTSTSTSSTLPPTLATVTTTLPPPTLAPITNPTTPNTITPGTVAVVTTAPPATSPPSPGTTKPPNNPTTSTTAKPKTTEEKLEEALEEALLGGPPPQGTPPRVRVTIDDGDEQDEQDDEVRVRWDLDASLSDEEQWYQARLEAARMLEVIQGFDGLEDEAIELRGFIDDPLPGMPDNQTRLAYVRYERATLDGIDFGSFDPLTVFDKPPADESDVDPPLDTAPPPTTTTSSTTTTT